MSGDLAAGDLVVSGTRDGSARAPPAPSQPSGTSTTPKGSSGTSGHRATSSGARAALGQRPGSSGTSGHLGRHDEQGDLTPGSRFERDDGQSVSVAQGTMTEPVPEPGTLAPAVTALDPWSPADGQLRPSSSCAASRARTAATRPCRHCAASTSPSTPATGWRSSGRPGPASPRCSTSSAASTARPPARYVIDGIDASGLSEDERASLRAQQHRLRVPDLPPARPPHGARERDARGRLRGRRPRRSRRRARGPRSSASGSATARTSCPPSSRAASSSGWRSRGRCSGSPRLLLCDEPTGNLDSANTESVLALFDELANDGLTLVVITHDEDVAARARRAVRIVDGRLTEVTA